MTIGEKLRFLRLKQDLTQQQISGYLNVNRTTYAKYEAGLIEMNVSAITTLACFFQVSSDYLLGIDTPTDPAESSKAHTGTIADSEYRHIIGIRKLDDRDRGYIEGQLKALLDSEKYQKKVG